MFSVKDKYKMFKNIAIIIILLVRLASHANSQGTAADWIESGERLRTGLLRKPRGADCNIKSR